MYTRDLVFILLLLVITSTYFAQVDSLPLFLQTDSSRMEIKALAINSNKSDFSPCLNQNMLLFVSSRPAKTGLYYTNELNTDITDLFYAMKRDSLNFGKPKPFSKVINSKYNEGPFTLSNDGTTIYFSGNARKGKDNKVPQNLQIYSSKKTDQKWNTPEVAGFCDPNYSTCHPAYSGDNTFLVFCSNMPGGYGGTDLYYTRFKNNEWSKPVNLGPHVNSAANELFPFIRGNSVLYFSSNRPTGYGNLDIYKTDLADSSVIGASLLEKPINSSYDDFGIWMDSVGSSGYLSSNRLKGIDNIYYFNSMYPEFKNSPAPAVKNKFCYSFFEANANQPSDSVSMTYEWDFGDGQKIRSEKCRYCFDRPGNYPIQLNVVEKNSGELFYNQTTYTLTIDEPLRLLISCKDTVTRCSEFVLDARKSGIKGYTLTGFYWTYGDGTYSKGPLAKHLYRKKGSYSIELGVTAKNENTQKIEKFKINKNILITDND